METCIAFILEKFDDQLLMDQSEWTNQIAVGYPTMHAVQ